MHDNGLILSIEPNGRLICFATVVLFCLLVVSLLGKVTSKVNPVHWACSGNTTEFVILLFCRLYFHGESIQFK